MRTIWMVVFSSLALGCGDKDGDDTAATGDDTAATGDDTAATGDDTAATGGEADAGSCEDYFGINGVGTTWEYQLSGQVSGSSTVTVANWDAATGDLTMETDALSEVSGTETLSLTTQSYRCDSEGVWLTELDVFYETYYNGSPLYSGWSNISYDSPLLLFPNGAAVGDTWTSVGVGVIETSEAASTDFETSSDFEIVSEESVTVIAGTYDALKIENTSSDSPGVATSWVALDVGTVKADGLELVAYTP